MNNSIQKNERSNYANRDCVLITSAEFRTESTNCSTRNPLIVRADICRQLCSYLQITHPVGCGKSIPCHVPYVCKASVKIWGGSVTSRSLVRCCELVFWLWGAGVVGDCELVIGNIWLWLWVLSPLFPLQCNERPVHAYRGRILVCVRSWQQEVIWRRCHLQVSG